MKRLVWLILASFCLAIAQVQPVEPVTKAKEVCGCCEPGSRGCGMPDCAPVPGCAAPTAVVATPTVSLRARADSVLPKSRGLRDLFYARFVPRPARPAELAPCVAAPAASVPVFKAHCSFLI